MGVKGGPSRRGVQNPYVLTDRLSEHLIRNDRMFLFLRARSSSRRELMSSLANTLRNGMVGYPVRATAVSPAARRPAAQVRQVRVRKPTHQSLT